MRQGCRCRQLENRGHGGRDCIRCRCFSVCGEVGPAGFGRRIFWQGLAVTHRPFLSITWFCALTTGTTITAIAITRVFFACLCAFRTCCRFSREVAMVGALAAVALTPAIALSTL